MPEYEAGRAPVSPAGPGRAWQEAGPPPVPVRNRSVPIWAIVAMVAGAVGILLCCGIGVVSAIAGTDPERAVPVVPSESPSEPPAVEASDSEPEPEASDIEPEFTVSQQQAIGSAESYLRFMGFSRSGLISQLEFEGFSSRDAEFAVDHLDVDWNRQAVRVAESYLRTMNFSRQGLIDQLKFEGFTQEQAEHGATEVGL